MEAQHVQRSYYMALCLWIYILEIVLNGNQVTEDDKDEQ